MEIKITDKAKEIIYFLKNKYPNLSLVIESTSCCSISSVFARNNIPNGELIYIGEIEGVKFYLDNPMHTLLKMNQLIIDVIDFTDDSLSLETDIGKRFILLTK